MALVNSSLATKGVDSIAKINILKRHFYSFVRHLTYKKFVNFAKTEINFLKKEDHLNSYPYILKIEPSNICNLRCSYCYDDRREPFDNERPYGRMSFEHFKLLIDEIGEYLFKINLYGFGEPWLFPETFEMIRYATDQNIGVAVSSNMNLKRDDLHRDILDSGLEVLIVSIHGMSQETYSQFMKGGELDVALKNVEKVVKERQARKSSVPFIDWQYCVTGFNEHEIAEARKMAKEIGVDQVRFIKPFFPDNASEKWFSSMFPRRTVENDTVENTSCSWPYRSAYINWDGGLLPCCRDFRLVANDFGNVTRESFSSIWNNAHYRSSRKLIAGLERSECHTMCSRCPVIRRKPESYK